MKRLVLKRKQTEDVLEIDPEQIIRPETAEKFDVRRFGDFAGLGYFLPFTDDWEIGKDSEGSFILLKLKK